MLETAPGADVAPICITRKLERRSNPSAASKCKDTLHPFKMQGVGFWMNLAEDPD